MSGVTWFWAITYPILWVAFFVLIHLTHKLGVKCRTLGWFWFTLVSVTLGSLATIVSIISERT